MKHSEIRARLSEYLERDLDPEERSRIQTHLEACEPCGSELRELRATVSLLRRLPEPGHPPGLGDAVMARVARDARGSARVGSLLRRAAEPRFAASLAAGIAGLFLLFQGGERNDSTPPRGQSQIASAELRVRFYDGAGVISGATPPRVDSRYTGRAEDFARQLRGAGHPYSESVASHFESQPNVVLADWQPR